MHNMNMWQFCWYYTGMFFWWIIGIAVIIIFIMWIIKQGTESKDKSKSPLEIIKQRYASGEITKEEYEKMKAELTRSS